MVPTDSIQEELEENWVPTQVNVLEEIFLCPAEGYNMGMLRSAWGTYKVRQFAMDEYATRGNYWGKSPINLHLGDPLQLRPVRAISVVDTAEMLAERIRKRLKVSTEAQIAIRCFRDFDWVCILRETKRFRPGDPLKDILSNMRNANSEKGITMDPNLWNMLQKQCVPIDASGKFLPEPRFAEERFQCGHTISMYWQTISKFFYLHACRQASQLGTTLYWCQAVDEVKGWTWLNEKQKKDLKNGLQRSYNINETGHLHHNLPCYVGQRIRTTEKIDNTGSQDLNLMQEAEGTVVHVLH